MTFQAQEISVRSSKSVYSRKEDPAHFFGTGDRCFMPFGPILNYPSGLEESWLKTS